MKWISCPMLMALFLTAHAAAPEARYDVRPVPKWVEPVSAPVQDDKSHDSGGTESLLVDVQVRIEKGESRYHHYLTKVVNRAGVEENAQVEISFDPQIEKLHLHSLKLLREGKEVDELKLGRIRVLQQEGELSENIVDGQLTFHALLSDLRVGDVIDQSYTIDRREPAWQDRMSGRITTQWGTPVSRVHSRISLKEGAPLYLKSRPDAAPKSWVQSGYRFYDWDQTNTPTVTSEKDAPSWYQSSSEIEYSQFADWAEVIRIAMPMYELPDAPAGELKQLIERFKAQFGPEQRVIAAMRFVQDEIRYTGIEEGIGAARPTLPGTVLARRFGDCKDKAFLAVALLRGLDVEAYPALVSTHWREGTKDRLAGPWVMNHVIVRADIDGKAYWFDATATGQGGTLATVEQASFGWALPIAVQSVALQEMPGLKLLEPTITVSNRYDLSDGEDQPAKLTVHTTYLRRDADSERRTLQSDGTDALAKDWLEYYQNEFSGVKTRVPLKVVDDRDANKLEIEESYEVEKLFKEEDGEGSLLLDPGSVNKYLRTPSLKQRKTPYRLKYPVYVTESFDVLLPKAWSIENEQKHIQSPAFDYQSDVKYSDKHLTLKYQYKSLLNHVNPDGYPQFLKLLAKADDDAGYKLSQTATSREPKERELTLAPSVDVVAGDFRVVKLVALFAALILVVQALRKVRAKRA